MSEQVYRVEVEVDYNDRPCIGTGKWRLVENHRGGWTWESRELAIEDAAGTADVMSENLRVVDEAGQIIYQAFDTGSA